MENAPGLVLLFEDVVLELVGQLLLLCKQVLLVLSIGLAEILEVQILVIAVDVVTDSILLVEVI